MKNSIKKTDCIDLFVVIIILVIGFVVGFSVKGCSVFDDDNNITSGFTIEQVNDSTDKYKAKSLVADSLLLEKGKILDSVNIVLKTKDSLLVVTSCNYKYIKKKYEKLFYNSNSDVDSVNSFITNELSK